MWIRFLKIAFFALISIAYHYSSFAGESPAARNCRLAGGQYWVLGVGAADDLALCRFAGPSSVDALSLYYKSSGLGVSQALQELYKNPQGIEGQVCRESQRRMLDSEGRSFELCTYADGSAVERHVLALGLKHPANAELLKALESF